MNITGTTNADILVGTDQNDTILGLGGNDRLDGLAGNDVLEGGEGNDIINGGLGTDTLGGGSGNDSLNDELSGGTSSLSGGAGDDTLVIKAPSSSNGTAVAASLILNGNDGRDIIRVDAIAPLVASQHDIRVTIDGGIGNDSINIGTAVRGTITQARDETLSL